jgi:predicted ester cyclase
MFFAAFAAALLAASCNDKTAVAGANSDNDASKKNLEASHVIDQAFKTGDVSKIDSVVAGDFLDHRDYGDVKSRDSLKALIKMVHDTFKDMKMETIHEISDKDYVYTWMRYSGTSNGEMGMPKGPYDMSGIELSKFKDGKVVEHWAFMNMRDMMKMMPQPGMNNHSMVDSTKAANK